LVAFAHAADNNGYYNEIQNSLNEISELKHKIDLMQQEGFSVNRLTDEFTILRQIHENNLFKISNNQEPDFSHFESRVNSIEGMMADAYRIKDELIALDKSINDVSSEIDTSQAKELYLEAEKEFIDERYEFALAKVDDAYSKIIELQGMQAKANAAYEAASKNIITLIEDNWVIILIAIFGPAIIYVIFRKQIHSKILQDTIDARKFEVDVLKNEIKNAQEIYFVKGTIPEAEYMIKVKLYGDRIRELNREIALFEEQKEKLFVNKKKGPKTRLIL
jgi:hypothetical protein